MRPASELRPGELTFDGKVRRAKDLLGGVAVVTPQSILTESEKVRE
jgi:hypothetical protein